MPNILGAAVVVTPISLRSSLFVQLQDGAGTAWWTFRTGLNRFSWRFFPDAEAQVTAGGGQEAGIELGNRFLMEGHCAAYGRHLAYDSSAGS